jgi:hypothetical protein
LKCRFAVNGIQKASRLLGAVASCSVNMVNSFEHRA